MAAEQAVIIGLGIVFAGLTWISFKLNDSDEQLSQYLGVMFLSLAVAMLQIIGWVSLEMAQANNLTYIVNGTTIGVTWVLNIALFLFWFILLLRSLIYMTMAVIKLAGKTLGNQVGK